MVRTSKSDGSEFPGIRDQLQHTDDSEQGQDSGTECGNMGQAGTAITASKAGI